MEPVLAIIIGMVAVGLVMKGITSLRNQFR